MLAAMCFALFSWTGVIEGRAPEAFAFPEATADIFHLLGNMLFLWLVGPLLDEAWGRRRILAFYLAAGLTASLVQFQISRGAVASIGGASGAIAGCMGAFALRFAATKIRFHYSVWFFRIFMGSVHVPAWICGVLWFGRELLDLRGGGASGVATGARLRERTAHRRGIRRGARAP